MANRLFATKSYETLMNEMAGEARLRRVLGPVALTSLGVGAIIGTGIFVLTGGRPTTRRARPDAVVRDVGDRLHLRRPVLCRVRASMVPVAGSAYTYAYTPRWGSCSPGSSAGI